MKRILTLVAVAAMLAGPALAATDVKSPQGLLQGQAPDNTAAYRRVAISTFIVQYVTDFGIETRRTRGGTFYSKWKAPPPELLQASADALYTQLVADLQAAGVEVVSAEQVLAHPAMADLRKAGRESPAVVNDAALHKVSTLVSARKLPLVLAPVPDAKLPSYATQPLEGTDGPRNLVGWEEQSQEWLAAGNLELGSLASIYFGQARMAEALNATVLNVRLTLPLVDMGVTTAGNAGGGFFGSAKVTGLIKPNPRLVEAGTVFALVQAGGNPGHRHVIGLHKPVPVSGLKVTTDIDKVSLDDTIFGKQSARGGGLLGLFNRSAGGATEEADFWVSVEAEGLQPALVAAGSTVFKELAQILVQPK
jgi:hypothetical protein